MAVVGAGAPREVGGGGSSLGGHPGRRAAGCGDGAPWGRTDRTAWSRYARLANGISSVG